MSGNLYEQSSGVECREHYRTAEQSRHSESLRVQRRTVLGPDWNLDTQRCRAGELAQWLRTLAAPVPGDSNIPSDLCRHLACTWFSYIHVEKTHKK